MKKLTKSILLSAGACFSAVDKFEKLYPKGIDVCWKCLLGAMQKELAVQWLVKMTYPKIPYIKALKKRAEFYRCCRDGLFALPLSDGRVFRGGRTIVSTAGLQWLEKHLLREKEPARNSRRIAEYHAWRKRFGSARPDPTGLWIL